MAVPSLSLRVRFALGADMKEEKEEGSPKKWYHVNDVPHFIISALGLFVVAAYTFYAAMQYGETRTANEIAKNAFIEANKSFIAFVGLFPNFTKDANGLHLRAGISLTNTGNTAALPNLAYVCKPVIRDDQNQPVYKCDLADPPASVPTVGPHQLVNLIGPEIQDSDIQAINQNKKSVYVFGYFVYSDKLTVDSLGIPRNRITSFCQQVIPTSRDSSAVAPNATANPQQGAQLPGPSPANSQADIQIVGLGCKGFDYCLDEACKPLPQDK